jgi:hypothetical protein
MALAGLLLANGCAVFSGWRANSYIGQVQPPVYVCGVIGKEVICSSSMNLFCFCTSETCKLVSIQWLACFVSTIIGAVQIKLLLLLYNGTICGCDML